MKTGSQKKPIKQPTHASILSGANQGRTLIVGSAVYGGKPDRRLLYPDCLGIDMQTGYGVDMVHDMEEGRLPELFDHVECLSVLEHSRRPWLMAQHIQESMRAGATIYLSVPFVWRFHGYPSDYWRMTHAAVVGIFDRIDFEAIAYIGDKTTLMVDEQNKIVIPEMYENSRIEVVAFGRKKGFSP